MSINPGRDLENERRGISGKGWGRLNRASQEPEFLQMKLAAAAARQKEPTLCLDNLEVSDWEANVVMPATKLFAVVIAIVPLALYIAVYPPDEIALRPADFPPCCNQLLDCPGIERDEFAYFYCVDARYVKGGQQFRQTCEEQLYFVERRRANE